MSPEPQKRPRRVPFTPKEVANLISIKKRREDIKLQTFKKSLLYKLQNGFVIGCFFIFCEVFLCFLGPASYSRHYSYKIEPIYGDEYNQQLKPIVSEIDFYGVHGITYKFVVNDFKPIPHKYCSFLIGSDFLLRKNLKGIYSNTTSYRLFSANPILFLILLSLVATVFGYVNNLNENAYSLMAISVFNALVLVGVLAL
jgi:hypothetical protein